MLQPAEIVWTVAAHWVWIALPVIVCTVIAWSVEVVRPTVWEGHAQLLLVENDPIAARLLAADGRSGGVERNEDEHERYLQQQVRLLTTETVYRRMYGLLEQEGIPLPSSPGEESSHPPGGIKQFMDGVLNRVRSVVSPPPIDIDRRYVALDRAAADFRARSTVAYAIERNTIDLVVRGPECQRIEQELLAWIESYIRYVADLSLSHWGGFLSSRQHHYHQAAKAAEADLEAFRHRHPGVVEQDLEWLEAEIRTLRQDMGHIRQRIDLVASLAVDAEAESAVASHKAELEALLATVSHRAEERMRQQRELDEVLEVLARLRARRDDAHARRENFERLAQDASNLMECRKVVEIQVSDPPTVSSEPVDHDPIGNIAIAALAGFGIGALLTLWRELRVVPVRPRRRARSVQSRADRARRRKR